MRIVDIISDVVDKMKVFSAVSIASGTQTTYLTNAAQPVATKYIYLAVAEGDLTSVINVGDTVWSQGGSINYPPEPTAIRTVAAVAYVAWFGGDSTRLDVTIYPESGNYTQVIVIEPATGVYTVTLDPKDIQYWRVGARMRFTDGGTYYYGVVTAVSSPTVTVLLDDLNNLSSITEFAMDINYRHGHPVDVFDQLQRMARNKNYKMRRFPVIALMQDFDEDIGAGINETPIQLIIAVRTVEKYTAAERYTNSFDGKRLDKLYERFIQYLEYDTHTYFRRMDASKIDRLYWGKLGALGNEDNKAYDLIDAIEINIDLKTLNTC